ncbi:MAG: hypothetical protein ABEJ87_04500 [Candidatus Nanohalobium sp.]
MDRGDIALIFISASIITGLAAGTAFNTGALNKAFSGSEQVHEHALFFVYANGTEQNLTADRFQLQSSKVHLENGKSNIVHKHASGVTWGQFLDTLNISIKRKENQSCLRMPEKTFCSNMTVMLNGDKFRPGKEIQQGDDLAIVMGENSTRKAKNYMKLDLPRAYRKRSLTTRV